MTFQNGLRRIWRRYFLLFFLGVIVFGAYQNFSNLPQGPTTNLADWGFVNINFNESNTFTTRSLSAIGSAPTLSEPLFPILTGELGSLHVAKGRPAYSSQKDDLANQLVTSTVAPSTQYAFGIDSSCDVDQEKDRCLRDNSIFVRLNPNSRNQSIDNSIQDKALFRFVSVDHKNSLAINTRDLSSKFLSFDFKLDRFYERSKSWTMLMQAFQEGVGGGPALDLRVERSQDNKTPLHQQEIILKLSAQTNDRSIPYDITQNTKRPLIYKDVCPNTALKFERERWYNITLKMNPSVGFNPTTNQELGEVVLLVDGLKICQFKGNWGFQSLDPQKPLARMGIDLGLYRARTGSMQTVYYDNIKYGPSLTSVLKEGTSRVKLPSLIPVLD